MSSKTTLVRTLVALLVAVGTVAVIMGAGRMARSGSIQDRMLAERVLPRVQIIQFDDTFARLDTTTGELHLFSGDFRNTSSRSQWRLHAAGVGGNSGYLEIQQPQGVSPTNALFLVDVVTGDTWVLSRRGARATWDHVGLRGR